jgi:hypothetical protein
MALLLFVARVYVKIAFIVFLLLSASLLTACFERRTTNPLQAYRYWSGENPGKDIQLHHARYWQSPHFTKEYERYHLYTS